MKKFSNIPTKLKNIFSGKESHKYLIRSNIMGKREFNQKAYDVCDNPAKVRLVELIEATSDYKLFGDLSVERYKAGDVLFKNGDKTVLFENEVRQKFDTIVQKYNTVHIPIRKQNTPADFYLVWRKDFWQFILIDKKTLRKNKNNIICNVKCNNEMSGKVSYIEDFMEIPKEETQWYLIGPNFKLTKLPYD